MVAQKAFIQTYYYATTLDSTGFFSFFKKKKKIALTIQLTRYIYTF